MATALLPPRCPPVNTATSASTTATDYNSDNVTIPHLNGGHLPATHQLFQPPQSRLSNVTADITSCCCSSSTDTSTKCIDSTNCSSGGNNIVNDDRDRGGGDDHRIPMTRALPGLCRSAQHVHETPDPSRRPPQLPVHCRQQQQQPPATFNIPDPITTVTNSIPLHDTSFSNFSHSAYATPYCLQRDACGRNNSRPYPNHPPSSISGYSPHHRTGPRSGRGGADGNDERNRRDFRAAQDRKLQIQLKKSKKILEKRIKKLFALLVAMIVLVVITTIPLFLLYPTFGRMLLMPWHEGGATLWQNAESSGRVEGEECVSVRDYFPAELLEQCGIAEHRLMCGLDAQTALCILTRAKNDLDRRTRILDGQLDGQNNVLIKKIGTIVNTSISVGDIGAYYHERAAAFLRMCYSSDYESTKTQSDLLKWTELEHNVMSVKGMKLNSSVIQISSTNYYHVYSHVNFSTSDAKSSNRLTHIVCRNKINKDLLSSNEVLVGDSRVSFLQGIFLLREGDTLFVRANIDLVDRFYKHSTFFGAFEIWPRL